MNTPKWLQKNSIESQNLFNQVRIIEQRFQLLGRRFSTEINLTVPDFYVIKELLELSESCFHRSEDLQNALHKVILSQSDQQIERNPYKLLLSKKSSIISQNLKRKHFQLIFIILRQINLLLDASKHSDGFIDCALTLIALYNKSVGLGNNGTKGGDAQVCSNTFTTLLLPQANIDVKYILQKISKYRSEQCCMALISSLLSTCKPDSNGGNADSDTSSVEVLKTLTSYMSSASPSGINEFRSIEKNGLNDAEDSTITFFDRMAKSGTFLENPNKETTDANEYSMDVLEHLVASEENYYANILLKCLKWCPSAFVKQPSKEEIIKLVNKGTRGLWTQTGSTLEHVVLWWCHTPLGTRPVTCAKYLRDWLLNTQPDDTPEPILSILRNLGETLTVHVACTTWDKQFRLTLVTSILPIDYPFESDEFYCKKSELNGTTTTGRQWSELLHTLTTFCNNCDQNSTIPNELPIVEQIAILHRLDHSIHTMRLWAAAKAKALCTDWNMTMFFKVVQNDVNQCLDQIKVLRVPDLVPTDPLEVQVKVCVALRAKLISEVKVNIGKLKLTYNECIDVLAAICKTMCLATLSLCFPKSKTWQENIEQEKPNDYVSYYLEQIYLPVLHATQVLDILNLVLRILCEAWLDHIYTRKIKFSRMGAINLLKDFDGVSDWILACSYVLPEHMEILAKHEVLRTCEGVGKILLRKPYDVISMTAPPSRKYSKDMGDDCEENAPLPPEMFVPNQQRWLELRARNRGYLCALPICAGKMPCI